MNGFLNPKFHAANCTYYFLRVKIIVFNDEGEMLVVSRGTIGFVPC